MKKIVALLIIIAMSAMLFACGNAAVGGTTASTATESPQSSTTFTLTAPGAKAPEPYADIDFVNGAVADSKGKILLEIKTNGTAQAASTEEISVDFMGYKKTFSVLRIKNTGTWVKGVFSDMNGASEMDAFVEESGGFTVEAFYVDNSDTGANRGIVCCTESVGGDGKRSGWGLAESAEGKPYFITGHTSENVYSSVYGAKASETEPVHVIAVYDAVSMRNSIYVNGNLVSSDRAAGRFTSANKTEACEGFEMGNAFYIGADPTGAAGKKEMCDFPSNDLTVLDVKFYNRALTAGEVSAVFGEVIRSFG